MIFQNRPCYVSHDEGIMSYAVGADTWQLSFFKYNKMF